MAPALRNGDDEMSLTCHHGQLARLCLACDLEREVAVLRALMQEMAKTLEDVAYDEEGYIMNPDAAEVYDKYKEMTK